MFWYPELSVWRCSYLMGVYVTGLTLPAGWVSFPALRPSVPLLSGAVGSEARLVRGGSSAGTAVAYSQCQYQLFRITNLGVQTSSMWTNRRSYQWTETLQYSNYWLWERAWGMFCSRRCYDEQTIRQSWRTQFCDVQQTHLIWKHGQFCSKTGKSLSIEIVVFRYPAIHLRKHFNFFPSQNGDRDRNISGGESWVLQVCSGSPSVFKVRFSSEDLVTRNTCILCQS